MSDDSHPIEYICRTCGDEVTYFRAVVRWDKVKQSWGLDEREVNLNTALCVDCGIYQTAELKEVKDTKTLALRAIHLDMEKKYGKYNGLG